MLIVVMMGKWSDDSACLIVHDVRLYSVLDTVEIYGEDVCCSVVFGTMDAVFVFSVVWTGLLVKSAMCCPLWLSVYECQRVEFAKVVMVEGMPVVVNVILYLMSLPPALCTHGGEVM